jgi:hypothetical protein
LLVPPPPQNGGGGRLAQAGGRKHFFFEKKKQKTLHVRAAVVQPASPKDQKFFGSFFQKRTARFL